MANWITIHITGSMSEPDAEKIAGLLDRKGKKSWDWSVPYACLSYDSSKEQKDKLGVWTGRSVNRTGTLARQKYTIEDVTDALSALLDVAPSMRLTVKGENRTIKVMEDWVELSPAEPVEVMDDNDEGDRVPLFIRGALIAYAPSGSDIFHNASDSADHVFSKYVIRPDDTDHAWLVTSDRTFEKSGLWPRTIHLKVQRGDLVQETRSLRKSRSGSIDLRVRGEYVQTLPAGSSIYILRDQTSERTDIKYIIKPGDDRVWVATSYGSDKFRVMDNYDLRKLGRDVSNGVLKEVSS